MSEYQYYEFQAIDRPLSGADREALRKLSTRARITATSFTNSYEWGDFKGDPVKLMERWFDLHLYLANWGSRRLMIRLPTRMVDRQLLDAFIGEVDCAELRVAGENLILDVVGEEVRPDDRDDGSSWLPALTPLRGEVLAGDLRLFYLLWLTAVETDVFNPDEPEPLPGIGPITGALAGFANFFQINPDLVAAAAERSTDQNVARSASENVLPIIAAMNDQDKSSLLARLFDGDAHVASELRALVRHRLKPEVDAPRTVGELRSRANELRLARERAEADRASAERIRAAQEVERTRRTRFDAIVRRGESVWREIEAEIERRNAPAYDKAASLLLDLRSIASENGTTDDFGRRLRMLRERHARKERLIERLANLG